MAHRLGRVLFVVNPAARNGEAAQAYGRVESLLREQEGVDDVRTVLTRESGEAIYLAAAAVGEGFDTLIAMGGDGIISEAARGLVASGQADPFSMPALGLVPFGSGNDYARTLGLASRIEDVAAQLANASARLVDVGVCNGLAYLETVSFGLDAAIALDTEERRRRTGRTGTLLYAASGFDQLFHHLDLHRCRVSFDGGEPEDLELYLFAVQNGRTYGGGFAICPEARVDDGLLDTCWAIPHLSVPRAAITFVRAKGGHHVGSPNIRFRRARRIEVDFEAEPPAQIDGEKLVGTHFDISVRNKALRVLFAGD